MALYIFIALGFLLATIIGVLRIVQNFLVGEERIIYFINSTVSGGASILFFLRIAGIITDLELFRLALPGVPFLIAGLILIQLFYRKHRRFPKF